MIFLVEDRAAEQAIGSAVLCDVRLLRGQILGSPARLGSCRFLYVITYQKIHCFYEVLYRTSDNGKPPFNSRVSRGTTPLLLCEGLQMGNTCASMALIWFYY